MASNDQSNLLQQPRKIPHTANTLFTNKYSRTISAISDFLLVSTFRLNLKAKLTTSI